MWQNIFRSWKTTLSGIVAVVAAVAPFIPGLGVPVTVVNAIVGIANGVGNVLAKDANQTGLAPAPVEAK